METASLAVFRVWESFYVIVGSSAAALTGLQFVVMALIADSSRKASKLEIDTFGTPNVVHFGAVLLMSSILSAPWHRLSSAAVPIALFGITGALYTLTVLGRARRTMQYTPVLEDWIWHVIVPLVSYAATTVAAFLLSAHAETALFVIGGMSLLLLFTGIHNAWDTITFITLSERNES
jgi:hypothetical protein